MSREKRPPIERVAGRDAERFWQQTRLVPEGDCWIVKSRSEWVYGQFTLDHGLTYGAHRVSWFLTRGPLPDPDLCVCHRCDNPPCVRPDHLFIGTLSDNRIDGQTKAVELLKLRREDYQQIRRSLGAGRTPFDVATEYKISRRDVITIRGGVTPYYASYRLGDIGRQHVNA